MNTAVWSGGWIVYVPKGVEVPLPLQAYFRINGENTGQFERTLIVERPSSTAEPKSTRHGREPTWAPGPLLFVDAHRPNPDNVTRDYETGRLNP